jgi:hypothetical protein
MEEEKLTSPQDQYTAVEKAKEELRKALHEDYEIEDYKNQLNFKFLILSHYNDLAKKAQNLLNAMDDSNIPEKGDCGIGEDTREERYAKVKNLMSNVEIKLPNPLIFESESPKSDMTIAIDWAFNAEPKSTLWKPVSELPKDIKDYFECFIKFHNGKIRKGEYFRGVFSITDKASYLSIEMEEYCSLTDYINHQAELEKRVGRLEQKEK